MKDEKKTKKSSDVTIGVFQIQILAGDAQNRLRLALHFSLLLLRPRYQRALSSSRRRFARVEVTHPQGSTRRGVSGECEGREWETH